MVGFPGFGSMDQGIAQSNYGTYIGASVDMPFGTGTFASRNTNDNRRWATLTVEMAAPTFTTTSVPPFDGTVYTFTYPDASTFAVDQTTGAISMSLGTTLALIYSKFAGTLTSPSYVGGFLGFETGATTGNGFHVTYEPLMVKPGVGFTVTTSTWSLTQAIEVRTIATGGTATITYTLSDEITFDTQVAAAVTAIEAADFATLSWGQVGTIPMLLGGEPNTGLGPGHAHNVLFATNAWGIGWDTATPSDWDFSACTGLPGTPSVGTVAASPAGAIPSSWAYEFVSAVTVGIHPTVGQPVCFLGKSEVLVAGPYIIVQGIIYNDGTTEIGGSSLAIDWAECLGNFVGDGVTPVTLDLPSVDGPWPTGTNPSTASETIGLVPIGRVKFLITNCTCARFYALLDAAGKAHL